MLELIYPNVCGICEEIDKNSLCENCKSGLDTITVAKIDNYENKTDKFFNEHGYIFKYEGQIRKLLIDYKFNNKSYLYKTFASIILSNKKMVNFINNYEIIIPVPIHKKRFNCRGYNQSELLAREISRKLKNIQFLNKLLIKTENNVAQSTLTKEERALNVKDIYKVKNNNLIKEKSIILLDDIYTTGNTVNECSKLLKKNGAREIGILTVSKD